MTSGKRYDFRTIKEDTGWSAEIIRRITSRKTVVSKKQSGFSTESDAQQWGQRELKSFLQNLNERNRRRTQQRNKKSRKTPRPDSTEESSDK